MIFHSFFIIIFALVRALIYVKNSLFNLLFQVSLVTREGERERREIENELKIIKTFDFYTHSFLSFFFLVMMIIILRPVLFKSVHLPYFMFCHFVCMFGMRQTQRRATLEEKYLRRDKRRKEGKKMRRFC